jgi:hypothetical protein
MKQSKNRPLRVYKNAGRRYVRNQKNGKKLYIKATNKNIVKVIVHAAAANPILKKTLPRRRAPNKKKTAFPEELLSKSKQNSLVGVPNTPYYQVPTPAKIDKQK